jgi:hypothetical protein
MSKPAEDDSIITKSDAAVTLAIHGSLVALLVWLFVFCSPVVDHVANGHHFPWQFKAFLAIHDLVAPYFSFVLPVALALFWLDAKVLLLLNRQRGRGASLLWSRALTLAL